MKRGPYKNAPQPGTVADLVLKYRLSPRVRAWAPSTRKVFDKTLGDFMLANHAVPVPAITRGDIIVIRDGMGATPGAANNWLKVIRGLLDYAVDLEMIAHNPAARVPKLKMPNKDGFRTWREDEIAAFLRYWPKGSTQHLVVSLALYTGAARDDLVRLGWGNIQGDRIVYRRKKTEVVVAVRILPQLAELLTQVPRTSMTFLETNDGRVRSSAGVAAHLLLWLEKSGLDGKDATGHRLSLHGLRKALGRRLAEAGASSHEIAAVLGHSGTRSAEVYTKAYDRALSADTAADKMLAMAPDTTVTRIRRKT